MTYIENMEHWITAAQYAKDSHMYLTWNEFELVLWYTTVQIVID